jgi:hypothetical protein
VSTEEAAKVATPTKTKYTISVGAASVLAEILPTTQWYKDEAKQGQLICRSFAACEAIPELPDRPKPDKDELASAHEIRLNKWGDPKVEVEWTDKEKEAVRACMRYYLKQGAFMVTKYAIELLMLLSLNDE